MHPTNRHTEKTSYVELVGKLLCISNRTRPDITFSVSYHDISVDLRRDVFPQRRKCRDIFVERKIKRFIIIKTAKFYRHAEKGEKSRSLHSSRKSIFCGLFQRGNHPRTSGCYSTMTERYTNTNDFEYRRNIFDIYLRKDIFE